MKKFISIFVVFLLMFTAISAFPVSADVGNAYKIYLSAFHYNEYTGQKVKDEDEYVIIEHFPDVSSYPIFSRSYIVPFSDVISGSFFLCDKLIYGQFRDSDNLYYIIFSKGNTPADYQEQIFLSSSPIYLRGDNDSYIYFDSDSDILCYTLGFSYDSDNKVYRGGALYVNKNYYAYGESYSKYKSIRYDKNTTSIKTTGYTPRIDKENYSSVTWDRIFSNCDLIDKSTLPNLTDTKISEIGSAKNPLYNVNFSMSPELEMDMDILDSDDRSFRFSFTNKSSKPVQFSLYIDEFDNKDTYYFQPDGYFKTTAHQNAVWNYKKEGYYYDINLVNNSKYLGIKVDHTLNPMKVHGTTVWHYLKPNETYSDIVYWANINVTTGKKYKINARACYVPSNAEYPSNIIDIDCFEDDGFFEKYAGDLAQHHWWTIDFLSNITISEKIKQYSVSSKDMCFLYQKEFSLISVPDFTNTVLGGNGTLSKGYQNDKDQFSSFDYKLDLDTGNETFGDGSSLSQLESEIDIENVKTGDVISYLKYCLSFFLIVKQAFTCFPPYIWVTIYFGITAMVVIGIVKSIL